MRYHSTSVFRAIRVSRVLTLHNQDDSDTVIEFLTYVAGTVLEDGLQKTGGSCSPSCAEGYISAK